MLSVWQFGYSWYQPCHHAVHGYFSQFCEQHQSGGRSRRLLGVGGWGLGAERESNQQKGLGQAWSKIKTAAANMKEKVQIQCSLSQLNYW